MNYEKTATAIDPEVRQKYREWLERCDGIPAATAGVGTCICGRVTEPIARELVGKKLSCRHPECKP